MYNIILALFLKCVLIIFKKKNRRRDMKILQEYQVIGNEVECGLVVIGRVLEDS